jgi:DNA-binding protein H-NS
METYKAVMAQIEKLKGKAEQLRQAEIKGVVDRIRTAMSHYGLTAEDLRLTSKAAPKAAKKISGKKASKVKVKVTAKPGTPKYRDPASGKTWTGHGKPPNWIVGIADRSGFLIAGAPAPAAKPAGKKAKAKTPAKSKGKRAAATAAVAEPATPA